MSEKEDFVPPEETTITGEEKPLIPSVVEEEALLLSICRIWKENPKYQGITPYISKKLKVKGSTVGKAIRYAKQGIIKFREGNEPYFAIPYPEIARVEKVEEAEQDTANILAKQARKTFLDLEVAETEDNVKQTYMLGRATKQAVLPWATKHGITPQGLRKIPIEDLIPEALDKMDKYNDVVAENKGLKNRIAFYEERLDPDIRLEKGLEMITNAMVLQEFYGEMGIDFLKTPAGQTYARGIDKYLTGVQVE